MSRKIGDVFKTGYDNRSFTEGKDLVDPSTFVGVEVEFEGVDYPVNFPAINNSPFWTAKHDDSLRGKSVEILFAYPLFGRDIETALHELEQDIVTGKKPCHSARTSTHVHIDINKLTAHELYRFILLSITLERVLYKYAGKGREKSVFCVPFYKADKNVHYLSAFLKGEDDIGALRGSVLSDTYRYAGINLHAILKYGTLEFRMLKEEWRYEKLVFWINVLLSIRKYAINMDSSMVDLHKDLSVRGPENLLDDVFGEFSGPLKYPDAKLDILRGIRLAQQVEFSDINQQLVWNLQQLVPHCNFKFNFEETHPTLFRKKSESKEKATEENSAGYAWIDPAVPPPAFQFYMDYMQQIDEPEQQEED